MLFALALACHGDPPPGDRPPGDDDDDDVTADACADRPDGAFCDGSTAVTCADGGVVDTEVCPELCVDGACFACAPPSLDAAALTLVPDAGSLEAADGWRLRPVVLTGAATLSVTGPFEVVERDGAPVSGAVSDRTVFVRATDLGAGTLTATPLAECGGAAATVDLASVGMPRLAGRVVAGVPGFDDGADLFPVGGAIAVDVPVATFPDRDGAAVDVWLVPHRDDWTDATLAGGDARGPFAGTVGAPIDVGPVPDGGLYASWDVVADLDRDGTLSPGDLLQGAERRPLLAVGDLSALGPHPFDQADASGSGAFIEQRIYWPTDLDTLDPVPVVVISHGNGHDYRWYDYLGQHLASHGYVVMSHRNNTEPGPVAASRTTIDNTDAFLDALPVFQGGLLDGEVDPHALVWIGHSRGGEGVVLAWRDLVGGQQTARNFGASDVVLLSSIAPTLFEGPEQADPGDTPYHLIAGSADGDVTGGVEQGLTQYFRIFQGATNQRMVTYVEGADHNDFNCCGIEDSAWQDGGPLIGRDAAQVVSRSIHLALLEAQFHGRSELLELLARSPLVARPFGPTVRLSTLYRPADGDTRVIDDFQTEPDPFVSSSGGAVSGDVRDPFVGPLDDDNFSLTWSTGDPMNGMTWSNAGDARPDRGFVFGWSAGDDLSLTFELVARDRDLRGWDALSFRAAQGTRHPDTIATNGDLTFAVELEDGAGVVATVPIAAFAAVPRPFDRGGSGSGRGWVDQFQTVSLPLTAFERAAPGFDRSDVRAVRLRFGAAHGTAQGRLGLDDLLFARELP